MYVTSEVYSSEYKIQENSMKISASEICTIQHVMSWTYYLEIDCPFWRSTHEDNICQSICCSKFRFEMNLKKPISHRNCWNFRDKRTFLLLQIEQRSLLSELVPFLSCLLHVWRRFSFFVNWSNLLYMSKEAKLNRTFVEFVADAVIAAIYYYACARSARRYTTNITKLNWTNATFF